MSINMMTPVTEKSVQNMVFNAGILLKNFNYAACTDAATLAAAIAAEKAKATESCVMGATKGGINPQTNFTFWSPEFDGRRMEWKGAKQLDSAECIISGTLVEFTPGNTKDVLALADVTTAGNITTVQPRFDIHEGDYIDHIVWVGNLGSDGLILVDLSNALCTTGLSSQTTDKDIGTLPFEFHGHAASINADELPIKYLFFGKA